MEWIQSMFLVDMDGYIGVFLFLMEYDMDIEEFSCIYGI